MANALQTTSELFKAKALSHTDIEAAVEAFMADKDTSGYKRRIDGALEVVRLKSAVFCRDREVLAMWLKERAG